MGQQKRTRTPEINPVIYNQLIFDKPAKFLWRNDSLFNSVRKIGFPYVEKFDKRILFYNLYKYQPTVNQRAKSKT